MSTISELPPEERTPIDSTAAPVDRRRALYRMPELARLSFGVVRMSAPREFTISIVLQVVTAVLVGVQLYVAKELITGLVRLSREASTSASIVIPSFSILLGITVATGVIAAFLALQQRMLSELVGRATMDRIIDVASSVELPAFEDPEFYDKLQRATTAGTFRPLQLVSSFLAVMLGLVTSAGIMVALLVLEPILVPIIILAALPILLANLRNSRKAYAFEYSMTTHARERLHLMQLLTLRDSAKELRVFSATGFLRRRYDLLTDERVRRMRVFVRERLGVAVSGTLASAVGTAIALGTIVFLLSTERTDIATAATSVLAMQVLSTRLNSVVGSLGALMESALFLEDLEAFLLLGKRIAAQKDEGAVPVAGFDSLKVDGLNFRYPGTDRDVLRDVDLELHRGEVIALVGENGSGKTTLVKLLCQLYRHEDGAILWNGEDVRELDPDGLTRHMTVLFQDFVQYHLTVAENIGLGRSDQPFDKDRIEEAARRAGADGIPAQLPNGYDNRLGRQFLGGAELSGGQWQRLALARAFYRGGDVLVLDEPTAALDPRAEFRLFEQMRELAKGRSVLLISHRFSNVRMADRIYVLDAGRVAEVGSHDELMAIDGLYADLFRLQAAAYLGEPAQDEA